MSAQRIRTYMVAHKKVTFQSMARHMGLRNADALYDMVNGYRMKKATRKIIKRWLKDHKKDLPKVRYP